MKKVILTSLFLSFLFVMHAQTVDELKKKIEKLETENTILQNKANFCDLFSQSDKYKVKSFHEKFELKILKIIGNKNEQTVDIFLTLRHSLPNQKLTINISSYKAYDEMGNAYSSKLIEFSENKSNSYVFQIIPYNQLIQGKITFRNVLPNIDRFSKVSGTIETENADGGDNKTTGNIELINTLIQWE